jgi:hypothetical protein
VRIQAAAQLVAALDEGSVGPAVRTLSLASHGLGTVVPVGVAGTKAWAAGLNGIEKLDGPTLAELSDENCSMDASFQPWSRCCGPWARGLKKRL